METMRPCSAVGRTGDRPTVCENGSAHAVAFMQSDMNFLRSSPVLPFDFVLHAPILLSYVFFSALRQSFMNALRSSPFFSPALVLQVFIRSCCAFSANAGVATAANAPSMANARNRFMGSPFVMMRIEIGFAGFADGSRNSSVDVDSSLRQA